MRVYDATSGKCNTSVSGAPDPPETAIKSSGWLYARNLRTDVWVRRAPTSADNATPPPNPTNTAHATTTRHDPRRSARDRIHDAPIRVIKAHSPSRTKGASRSSRREASTPIAPGSATANGSRSGAVYVSIGPVTRSVRARPDLGVEDPNRQARGRQGKFDPGDADEAARAALPGRAHGIAKTADGSVEARRADQHSKERRPRTLTLRRAWSTPNGTSECGRLPAAEATAHHEPAERGDAAVLPPA